MVNKFWKTQSWVFEKLGLLGRAKECQAIRKSKASTKRKWALKLDCQIRNCSSTFLVVMAHWDKNDVFEARLRCDWKPFKSNLTSESGKAHAQAVLKKSPQITQISPGQWNFYLFATERVKTWKLDLLRGPVVSITVIIIFDIKVGLTKWRSSPQGGVAF